MIWLIVVLVDAGVRCVKERTRCVWIMPSGSAWTWPRGRADGCNIYTAGSGAAAKKSWRRLQMFSSNFSPSGMFGCSRQSWRQCREGAPLDDAFCECLQKDIISLNIQLELAVPVASINLRDSRFAVDQLSPPLRTAPKQTLLCAHASSTQTLQLRPVPTKCLFCPSGIQVLDYCESPRIQP